jgi:hypothetical protein
MKDPFGMCLLKEIAASLPVLPSTRISDAESPAADPRP